MAQTVEAMRFDTDGNPLFSGLEYEKVLEISGEAFDFGIEEFEMEMEIGYQLEWLDNGTFLLTLSVNFEGEISCLNGATSEYMFDDELEFIFTCLDQVNFDQIPQGFFDEIARFAADMGEAWDLLGIAGDHIAAMLLQLQEEGHYQAWDDADEGLDNPFDDCLPPIDPFA